jgi:hypothetical protein
MGPWRGPLPKRRVTPPPVLGQFLEKASMSSEVAAAGIGGALRLEIAGEDDA